MEVQSISILNIAISFAAGILSFLSPCVLPLVPGYISLISGVSIDGLKEGTTNRRAVIVNSLAFNAGLSVIFLILGTTAGLVGAAITSNPWVRIVGGIVIIAFGLQLIGLLKISALYKDTRFFSDDKPRGILGSAALGIAFAAGWTPPVKGLPELADAEPGSTPAAATAASPIPAPSRPDFLIAFTRLLLVVPLDPPVVDLTEGGRGAVGTAGR